VYNLRWRRAGQHHEPGSSGNRQKSRQLCGRGVSMLENLQGLIAIGMIGVAGVALVRVFSAQSKIGRGRTDDNGSVSWIGGGDTSGSSAGLSSSEGSRHDGGGAFDSGSSDSGSSDSGGGGDGGGGGD
jgi:hypothetical protein